MRLLQIWASVFAMIVAMAAAPIPTAADMLLAREAAREVVVIRGLLKMGDVDQATTRLARIADSQLLYEVRTLKDFEALWNDPTAQTYLRPEEFAARHILAAKARSEQNARDLQARSLLIYALVANGRFDQAIETAQETLRNLSVYRADREAEAWVRNYLAYALLSAGDYEAADTALKPIVRRATAREPYLVNFSINYGLLALFQGRFEGARTAARLAESGPASAYARSNTRYIHVCALHGLGQSAAAQAALDALVASPGQSPWLTIEAYLCVDRIDDAADLLVTMLQDDGQRSQAMNLVQSCMDNPRLPQFMRDNAAKYTALSNRPNVRMAIERVGVLIVKPQMCGWY